MPDIFDNNNRGYIASLLYRLLPEATTELVILLIGKGYPLNTLKSVQTTVTICNIVKTEITINISFIAILIILIMR
jgi:adenosine/AMP kinase